MTSPVVGIDVATPVAEAIAVAGRAGVSGLLVMEQDLAVGLLTEVELLEARFAPPSTPAEEVMTQALLCLPVRMPLHRAAGFATTSRARRIAAIDHREVVGIVTGLDFARVVAERA
jgi:CBS domain-containing protein